MKTENEYTPLLHLNFAKITPLDQNDKNTNGTRFLAIYSFPPPHYLFIIYFSFKNTLSMYFIVQEKVFERT